MPLRQLERPHFFTGKLLTAEDLQREQAYHRDKARLHNRFLHGWGVVTGLKVSLDQGSVVVSPGVALDCAGNELVLSCEARISLSGVTGRRYVTVRYAEFPVGQVPSSRNETEPLSIREGVAVALSTSNPHATHRAAQPGCGVDHALCIAALHQRGQRWSVTRVKAGALRRA